MLIGMVWLLLASVTFGVSPVLTKEILESGLDTQSMLSLTNGITAIVTIVIMVITRVKVKITRKQLWQLLLFCGGAFSVTILLLSNSYLFLPIGLATMMHFIYPVLVTVGMVIFFKERISAEKVYAITAALVGLFLILDISGGISLQGAIMAIVSGFAYAVYVTGNRKCSYQDLPVMIVVLATAIVAFFIFSVTGFVSGTFSFPMTPKIWLFIFLNAFAVQLIGVAMLTLAVRRLGASNAAIGNMFEPMTAFIAGAIIYGDSISLISLGGCVMILLAISLIALDEMRSSCKTG